ncbi:MAG TPA: hypothetical protein VEL79_01435 [Vicinamibacterales bacterium]|nr:hypothetical protein [Vicinamibacterales bacterium]
MQQQLVRRSSAVAVIDTNAHVPKCQRCHTGDLVRGFGEPEDTAERPHVTLYVCTACGWSLATVY